MGDFLTSISTDHLISHRNNSPSVLQLDGPIAGFSSLVAVLLGLAYWWMAWGLESSALSVALRATGVGLFLIHSPRLAHRIVEWRGYMAQDGGLDDVWRLLAPVAALLVVSLAGLISVESLSGGALLLIDLLGWGCACVRAVHCLCHFGMIRIAGAIFAALILAAFLAGVAWGEGYQNPLALAGVANGHCSKDTVFHASIAAMIKTYGVPSTGLDGLPYVPYHFGTHWLFARLSDLLGISVFDFYNGPFALIFIPFLLYSLFVLSIALFECFFDGQDQESPTRMGPEFWLVTLASIIGVLPDYLSKATTLNWDFVFVSESYSVAVATSLYGLAAFLIWWRSAHGSRFTGTRWDLMLLWFVFPLLLGVIGLLKISVCLLLFAMATYFFFRLKLYAHKATALAWGIAAASTAVVFLVTFNPSYSNRGVQLFAFAKMFTSPTEWGWLYTLMFSWPLVAMFLCLRWAQCRTWAHVAKAWVDRRTLLVEFLLLTTVLGAMPGLLIRHESSFYFSDYQHWLAVPVVLASCLAWRRRPRGERGTRALGGASVGWLLGAPALLGACLTLFPNTLVRLFNAAEYSARQVGGLADYPEEDEDHPFSYSRVIWSLSSHLHSRAMDAHARINQPGTIVAELRALQRLPRTVRRRTALYIPKSNRTYWDLIGIGKAGPGGTRNDTAPFLAPALAEMVMLNGLPDQVDKRLAAKGFGYSSYADQNGAFPASSHDSSRAELCERARKWGCDQIVILEASADGMTRRSVIDCSTPPAK